MTDALLKVENLAVDFSTPGGSIHAVKNISFKVGKGETLALVGESGSGKSVSALSILQLLPYPVARHPNGSITFEGKEMIGAPDAELRAIRGNDIAMIFQEPMTSLSPVHNIGSQIAEAIRLHTDSNRKEAKQRAIHIMERVGIPDASRRYDTFPHELSGGLRQRAMIAMALSCRPTLLIADEPTTALDVTIQAQILALMRELQEEFGMAILLITHDLGVVAQMADEVAVMYWGRIVEYGEVHKIFQRPEHPYTEALMRSLPGLHIERQSELAAIRGSVPDPFQGLAGCAFHPRCDEYQEGLCDKGQRPPLHEIEPGHLSACLKRGTDA